MTPRGETAPLCPLVRDALDRRVHSIDEALVDGERAWAYSAEGGGGDPIARVTRTAATALDCQVVTELPTRDEAAALWRAYLGRCMLSRRVVTERLPGESVEAWKARDLSARAPRVGPRMPPRKEHTYRTQAPSLRRVWDPTERGTTCLTR